MKPIPCPNCIQPLPQVGQERVRIGDDLRCPLCGHVWKYLPGGDIPANRMAKRHGPGVWEDVDGGLHFSLPELLEYLEAEDTPENRREIEKAVQEIVAQQFPNSRIIHRE